MNVSSQAIISWHLDFPKKEVGNGPAPPGTQKWKRWAKYLSIYSKCQGVILGGMTREVSEPLLTGPYPPWLPDGPRGSLPFSNPAGARLRQPGRPQDTAQPSHSNLMGRTLRARP